MQVSPVAGIPDIQAGDDLGAIITAHADLDDVAAVCVASTVVAKAAGRTASLDDFPPGERARAIANQIAAETGSDGPDPRFVQAVLEESEELLIESPFLLAVTDSGHVAPNAGIDRSNVAADILRLPIDPMASAAALWNELPTAPAVIVTDTCGRPFRTGQRGVAVGYAGIQPHRDWRGAQDRHGRELTATVECVVDELAGAANLVMGEGAGGTPVALVRDVELPSPPDETRAGEQMDLYRSRQDDYVRQALAAWEGQESE